MGKPSITVLLIEPEAEARQIYSRFLAQDPEYTYQLIELETGRAALSWCQQHRVDLVLLNLNLPDLDGVETLIQLRQPTTPCQPAIVVLPEEENANIAVQVMKLGANDYLLKASLTDETLQQAIHNALSSQQRLSQLQQAQEQQRLITTIALRIRQSLELEAVLDAVVTEVRQLLQTDRVLVYQFHPDWSGTIMAESVGNDWSVALGRQVYDTCFQTGGGQHYLQGRKSAIQDVYKAGLSRCHLQLLEKFQVRANLVVPILLPSWRGCSPHLWGLLVVHHCATPRNWQPSELDLLDQLSVQIAIAIQQAHAHAQLQAELAERQWAEARLQQLNRELETRVTDRTAALQASEIRWQQQAERQQVMGAVIQRIRQSLDLETILNTTVAEIRQMLQADRVLVYQITSDGMGCAVAESVTADWVSVLHKVFPEEVFPQDIHQRYLEGHICALANTQQEGVLPCLVDFLHHLQVQAKLVVPIIKPGTVLWGLLIAHQCAHPRQWQDWEMELMQQIADQLAIGIQQSELYKQLQGELLERQAAEARIQANLNEKELLLKEIHHRVKNNLQVISSIFSLQSRYVEDPNVILVLKESRNRIRSMALIHERLYQSSNLAQIDFSDYIKNLTHELFASYNISRRQIQTQLCISNIVLNLDTAIPCGLLINELISNALKHGFPNRRTGQIQIEFTTIMGEDLSLMVKDNGIGLPPNFDIHATNSLGMRLIEALTRQLEGQLEIVNEAGACFHITFPKSHKVSSNSRQTPSM